MSLRARTAFAAFVVLVWMGPHAVLAQQAARPPPDPDDAALASLVLALAAVPVPQQADGGTVEEPRVELVVTFAARSLVFEEIPRIRVAFGGPRHATWQVERTNLPARVERGVEYRDVKVRLTLWSTVDEFESLLEDARRVAGGIRTEEATPR